MTTLILFSEQPFVHVLGWTLLHFCWQGTIVAILLVCVLGLLNGKSPQLRYLAACCALVLMAVLPLATFGYLATAQQAVGSSITSSTIAGNTALSPSNVLAGTSETWLDRIAGTLDQCVPWVLAVWFAGVIFLLGRLNLGLIVARRMKSVATQPASLELQRLFHELSRRLGVVRTVKLMNSALVQVPTVIGWLRPVILIPIGCLTGLSAIQVEAVLAHELAHIRRHDYLINVFQSVMETLLFYHPAVWWISKQARKEREHCCDDLAVRISGDSFAYAKALSSLEEHRYSAPMVALGANGGVLTTRIMRLLGCKETPAISRLAALTLLAVVVGAAGLCIGTIARAQSNTGKPPAVESSTASQPLSGVYRQWLDEDVRWIITPEERAMFLHLSTNEERGRFIQQFWQHRNPTPGAAINKFKQEHYRRIAYANEHFAAAGIPGWRTDRGRIYIVNGPPEEIKVLPAGKDGSARPTEIWHYRSLQQYGAASREQGNSGYTATIVTRKDVDMNFVDVCSCGNYQLQPSSKN